MADVLKRADVFRADVSWRSGSEQRRRRPVIVISSDGFHSTPTWRSVIVVPLAASSAQARRGRIGTRRNVELVAVDTGLRYALDLV